MRIAVAGCIRKLIKQQQGADHTLRTLRRIARSLELSQEVPPQEKLDAVRQRYQLFGKIELLHKEFIRAYQDGSLDKLGEKVKEELKNTFDSLMQVVGNAKSGLEEISETPL